MGHELCNGNLGQALEKEVLCVCVCVYLVLFRFAILIVDLWVLDLRHTPANIMVMSHT